VNLAYQMLGDVGDAEDVAQEAVPSGCCRAPTHRRSTTSVPG